MKIPYCAVCSKHVALSTNEPNVIARHRNTSGEPCEGSRKEPQMAVFKPRSPPNHGLSFEQFRLT